MTTSKAKKRKEQEGTKLQAGIKGREFDLASKLFNLTDAKNPSKPEQRLRCPSCGAKHCFDFNREDATFYCEGCKFFGDLTELVQKAREVSRNEAHDIIAEAAGLRADEKRDDRIPATVATDAPAVPVQEPPVPANNSSDTVSEQSDANKSGVHSTQLASGGIEMIALENLVLSNDYLFRVQDDADTIERYAEIISQYLEELAAGKAVQFPFPPLDVLLENGEYSVTSGRHRLQAAQKAGMTELPCIVLTDPVEAIQVGLKSNSQHGLPLNKQDKLRCIKIAVDLSNTHSLGWSTRKIGELVGCTHGYVASVIRNEGLRTDADVVIGNDGKPQPARKTQPARKNRAQSAQTKEDATDETNGSETLAPAMPPNLKEFSSLKERVLAELENELELPISTPDQTDELLGVFRMMIYKCFDDTKIRGDFLRNILEECAVYAVCPETDDYGYADAA